MRSIILCFLLCFLLGCANPHITRAPDITEPDVRVSHGIPTLFEDVEYHRWTKNRVAELLDRFPQIHQWLRRVIITVNIKGGVSGWCDWGSREILIKHQMSWVSMRSVLYHEIAHALQRTSLTEEQLKKWVVLAAIDLDEIGLEDFTGKNWIRLKKAKSFPTTYATKDIWEYMAEHFEEFMNNRGRHQLMYPEENALIIECGWEPK